MSRPTAVRFTERAYRQVEQMIASGPKLETGGMLLGHEDESKMCVVEHATGPGPNARRKRRHLTLDAAFLQVEQDRLMDAQPQLRFLGDWHYHTAGNGDPSGKDRRTLIELATDPEYLLGEDAAIVIATRNGGITGLRAFGIRDDASLVEIPVRDERVDHVV